MYRQLFFLFIVCFTDASMNSSSSGPVPTSDCPISCMRKAEIISSLFWSSVSITATITAETKLFVVNANTNNTETTTITNTEIDVKQYTPITDLNSAGIRTTKFTLTSDNSVTTQTVAYPTTWYQDYASSYTLFGTLPTTLNGVATCIKHSCKSAAIGDDEASFIGAPTFMLPSHPSLPRPSQTGGSGLDPKGLTYEAVWSSEDYREELEPLFPDLGVWGCHRVLLEQPATVKETALYLTATSTVVHSGDYANSIGPSYSGTRLPIGAAAAVLTTTAAKDSDSDSAIGATESVKLDGPKPTSSRYRPVGVSPSASMAQTESGVDVQLILPFVSTSISTNPDSDQGLLNSPISHSPTVESSPPISLSNQIITKSPTEPNPPSEEATANVLNDLTKPADVNSLHLSSQQTFAPDSAATFDTASNAVAPAFQTRSSDASLTVESINTMLLKAPATATPIPIILGTLTATANSLNQYILESQTLALGTPITFGSDTLASTVQLQTAGSNTLLILGSSTSTLIAAATNPTPQPFTIGNEPLTANSQDQFIVGSQTLTPGAAMTISGTPVSLAPDATEVVVGSSTQGLTGPIGGTYGAGLSRSSSGVQAFTGAAAKRRCSAFWTGAGLGIGATILAMVV